MVDRTLAAIAAAAGIFGLQGVGETARSQTPPAPDQTMRPAAPEERPIPAAGPLIQPKSLDQIGLPAELTRRAIPADNPQTPAKIALGEKLFFDGRLSADGTVACSTCHDPARAFTDGKPVSIGIKGGVGQRNAPTILNALYDKTQFWDGRAKTLEDQAALPIVNPLVMGQPSLRAAIARISAIADYRQAFRRVCARPPMAPTWCVRSHPTNGANFRSLRRSTLHRGRQQCHRRFGKARLGAIQHPGALQ